MSNVQWQGVPDVWPDVPIFFTAIFARSFKTTYTPAPWGTRLRQLWEAKDSSPALFDRLSICKVVFQSFSIISSRLSGDFWHYPALGLQSYCAIWLLNNLTFCGNPIWMSPEVFRLGRQQLYVPEKSQNGSYHFEGEYVHWLRRWLF